MGATALLPPRSLPQRRLGASDSQRRGVGVRRIAPQRTKTRDCRRREHQRLGVTLVDFSATLADNAILQNLSAVLNLGGGIASNVLPWPLSAIVSTLSFDLSSAVIGEVTSQSVAHLLVSSISPTPACLVSPSQRDLESKLTSYARTGGLLLCLRVAQAHYRFPGLLLCRSHRHLHSKQQPGPAGLQARGHDGRRQLWHDLRGAQA